MIRVFFYSGSRHLNLVDIQAILLKTAKCLKLQSVLETAKLLFLECQIAVRQVPISRSYLATIFREPHSIKSFAGDELAYLEGAHRRITTLHEELQSASNKLTTAHINLSKKFPLCARKSTMSRRKKENKRKVRKTKDKRLKQRARHLLGNLTSNEVAGKFSVQSKRMVELLL